MDFRKPIPLGEEIRVIGWLLSEGTHSVTAQGIIYLSDGTIAVEAKGKYAIAPQLFKDVPHMDTTSGIDAGQDYTNS